MQGTPLAGRFASLFKGCTRKIIWLKSGDPVAPQDEIFLDLQMLVKRCNTVENSLQQFVAEERLENDNQYDASGDVGKQDAVIKTEFLDLPPVLQLHLVRWERDIERRLTRLNDRFEYQEVIDLAPFLSPDADSTEWAVYELYGVLVHTGVASGGHYYAFLRATLTGPWDEFNDTIVSKASPGKAIAANFGGSGNGYGVERTPTAYVRKEDDQLIYTPVKDLAIPEYLRERNTPTNAVQKANKSEFEIATEDCVKQNAAYGRSAWGFHVSPDRADQAYGFVLHSLNLTSVSDGLSCQPFRL
jgi:ubiquitin carboxyl-terminal hydrolase 7